MQMSLVSEISIQIFQIKRDSKNYLSDICDTFSFSNLILGVTNANSLVDSSIDMMLTNRQRSFHHTSFIKTVIIIIQQTFGLVKTSCRCLMSSSSEDVFKPSCRDLDQDECIYLGLDQEIYCQGNYLQKDLSRPHF